MNRLAIFSCLLASSVVLAQDNNYQYHHEEEEEPSFYEFKYGVEDSHTGDFKSHHEQRHGKEVSGIYTVKEADGTSRVVKYHAGPHTGFRATVQRKGHAQHPQHYTPHKKTNKDGLEDIGSHVGLDEEPGEFHHSASSYSETYLVYNFSTESGND